MSVIITVKKLIYGQATPKNKLITQLLSISSPLIEHQVKYYAASDDCAYLKHWALEIHAFLPSIPKLKASGKFPSSSWIYDLIYVSNQERISSNYKVWCRKEHLNLPDDFDQMVKFVDHYCFELTQYLSKYGEVSFRWVERTLQSLKYDCQYYQI